MQNFGERRFVFQEAPGSKPSHHKVLEEKIGNIGTPEWEKEQEEAVRLSKLRQGPMAELADELATPGLGEAFDMVGELRDKFADPEFLEKNPPLNIEEARGYRGRLMAIAELAASKGMLGKKFDLFGSKVTIIQDLPSTEAKVVVDILNKAQSDIYVPHGFELSLLQDDREVDRKFIELSVDEYANYPYSGPFLDASVSFLATRDESESGTVALSAAYDNGKIRVFADTILPRIEKYLESL